MNSNTIEMNKLSIALGADHAGFKLKEVLKSFLEDKGYTVKDYGAYSEERADYPDFAHLVAGAVEKKEFDYGILLCGSGNGINMAANKHKGIRSALCWNEEITQLARQHNNANVLALPARFIDESTAKKCVNLFIETPFEGGRHIHRINKITEGC